jgi:hypothetical protein
MGRINNDLQYEMELWWLGEFERALARLAEAPSDLTGADPKMALRLQDFEQQRMIALRREITTLRRDLRDYEQARNVEL